MARLWQQTEREKRGHVAGLGLFFGALLGANLGTLEAVPIGDYVKLIIILAGTVMTIRMMSTSEDRRQVVLLVLLYAVLIAALLLLPDVRPEGMPLADLHKLVVTLAIWIGCVLLLELSPVREEKRGDSPQA